MSEVLLVCDGPQIESGQSGGGLIFLIRRASRYIVMYNDRCSCARYVVPKFGQRFKVFVGRLYFGPRFALMLMCCCAKALWDFGVMVCKNACA